MRDGFRRRRGFYVGIAAILGAVVVPLAGALPSAYALSCGNTASALKPTIKSSVVDQGLDYPTIIRGKQTIVRYALTLGCSLTSAQHIDIGAATLQVTIGTSTTTVRAFSPTTRFAPTGTLPVPSDPEFVIPGSALRPPTSAATGVTFSATIPYTSYNGTTVVGSGVVNNNNLQTISTTINKQTNGLRILAVPIGDGSSATPQFSASAVSALQNAMAAVGRIYPVPDGVDDLNSTADPAAGVRYALSGLLDVHNVRDATGAPIVDANGTICVSNSTLNAVRGTTSDSALSGTLAGTLNAWNAANPGKADIAIGVVDSAISRGGSCSLGIATVGQPTAMVVVAPDVTGAPSASGAVAAMEIAHTLGDIPASSSRMSQTSAYHSPNPQADSVKSGTKTISTNRAYNTLTGGFLPGAVPGPAGNFSTMDFTGGNDNSNTSVFEAGDWAYLACKLGSATNTECTTSGVTGAPAGADPLFYIAGSSDGSVGGTDVAESYFLNGGVASPPADASSPYHLVFTNGSTTLSDVPITVSTTETKHGEPNTPTTGPGVFQATVPFPTTATHVELRNGATVLYAIDRNQVNSVDQPPVVSSISTGFSTGPSTQITSYSPAFPDDSVEGTLSDDGSALAWTMDGRIFFASGTDPTPQATGHFSEFVDPDKTFTAIHGYAWSADGSSVAVTASFASAPDELWRINVNRNVAPSDSSFVTGAIRLGLALGSFGTPSWSPDGSLVAVADTAGLVTQSPDAGQIETFDANVTDGSPTALISYPDPVDGIGDVAARPSWSHAPGSHLLVFQKLHEDCQFCGSAEIVPVVRDLSAGPSSDRELAPSAAFYGPNPTPSLSLNADGYVVFGDGNQVQVVPVDQSASPKLLLGTAEEGLSLIHGRLVASLPTFCGDGCADFQLFSMPVGTTGATVIVDLPGQTGANLRLDVYLRCGTSMIPVAVGVKPNHQDGFSAVFGFEPLDTSNLCAGGTLVAVASDGLLRSDPTNVDAATPVTSPPTPPRPAIYSPTAGTADPSAPERFLSSQSISLVGGARDGDDGQVADSGLSWFLDGATTPVVTGADGTIPAPAPGTHTVRLHAVDSGLRSADISQTFVVVADANSDGIPDSDTCGTPPANGDPTGDANGDGISNIDSVTLLGSACTSATAYGVSTSFSPDPLAARSLLGLINVPQVTVKVSDTFADLTKVDATTVQLRIGSALHDTDADCSDLVVPATKALLGGLLSKPWSVSGGVGTAQFSRTPIQSYFANRCKVTGTIPFTITGSSLDRSWTFTGTGTFVVNDQASG